MARRWLVHAKDYPTAEGKWGDSITLPLGDLLPTPSITAVRVRKAMIPLLSWNVVTDNQTVALTIGGDLSQVPTDPSAPAPLPPGSELYSIVIPPGCYSGSGLASKMVELFTTQFAASAYAINIALDPISFRTTITVTNGGAPIGFSINTWTMHDASPGILSLLGFAKDPIIALTGTAISEGALNAVTDRYLLITCDEAKGGAGALCSLSPAPWHDGIISVVMIPERVGAGDVIAYSPEDDAPWIGLVRGSTNGAITLRLARNDYAAMGGAQISWAVELEVRV